MRDAMDLDDYLPQAGSAHDELAMKALMLEELEGYRLLHPGNILRAYNLHLNFTAEDQVVARGVEDPEGTSVPFQTLMSMVQQLCSHSTQGRGVCALNPARSETP